MARLGPDVSNHQGEITPAIAQCMAANGQTCAVVRLSLEDTGKQALARRQIQAFQGAGLAVMGYIWCYFTEDPVSTAQQALDWYGDLDPVRWWLDCEETDPRWRGSSADQRALWLDRCLDTLEALGMAAGIYTANWWWSPYMAGSTTFSNHPLWVAEYDNVADLDRFFPFGGWDHCYGKQFTGAGSLCGVNPLDLNVFSDGLFSEVAPVADLAEQWISAMAALTGTPYVFGGKDIARDGGLDCSGLLTSTAQQVGLDLGDPELTNADGLKQYADPVQDPRRGDIVLFSQTYGGAGPDYATHCGAHLSPSTMLDTHDGVHETYYGTPEWDSHFMGWWRPRGLASATPKEVPVPEQSDADKLSYLSALTHDILPAVIAELEAARGKAEADQGHIDRALTALREHAG